MLRFVEACWWVKFLSEIFHNKFSQRKKKRDTTGMLMCIFLSTRRMKKQALVHIDFMLPVCIVVKQL